MHCLRSNWLVAAATMGAIVGLISGCAQTGAPGFVVTSGTVMRNVTVVNTRNCSLQPGMAVVVNQGKLEAIDQNESVRASSAAHVIDVSRNFIVPGYLDVHTHSMRSVDQHPPFWPLFIANGVTGVRDMNGSDELIQRARKLNADRAAGRVDATEIVLIAGDLFVGQIRDATAAAAFVQQQKTSAPTSSRR